VIISWLPRPAWTIFCELLLFVLLLLEFWLFWLRLEFDVFMMLRREGLGEGSVAVIVLPLWLVGVLFDWFENEFSELAMWEFVNVGELLGAVWCVSCCCWWLIVLLSFKLLILIVVDSSILHDI
jgi:hypothetical protein